MDELTDMFSSKMSLTDILRQKIEQYPHYKNMLIKTYNFWMKYGGNTNLFPMGGDKNEFSKLLDIVIMIMNSSEYAFGRTKRRSRRSKRRSKKQSRRRSRRRSRRSKRRSG